MSTWGEECATCAGTFARGEIRANGRVAIGEDGGEVLREALEALTFFGVDESLPVLRSGVVLGKNAATPSSLLTASWSMRGPSTSFGEGKDRSLGLDSDEFEGSILD